LGRPGSLRTCRVVSSILTTGPERISTRTGRACVFEPDMAFHLHDGWDVIELFGDLFTDAAQTVF
jgi:hypothetical protein